MLESSTILQGVHVLDGGLASELEYRGARIDRPLWSAQVLEDEPEKVAAVHRAYIEAGAQCIATCSYQVSRMGYVEVGLPPNAPMRRCCDQWKWRGRRRRSFQTGVFW